MSAIKAEAQASELFAGTRSPVQPSSRRSVLPPIPEATHGKARPSGIIGKICPHCNAKYDLEATFCGKDGSELVAVN